MVVKLGRELWRSLVYLWETSPYQFIELLLLMMGGLSVVTGLILGQIWPFGFLALWFLMACSLCLLLRETMQPTSRQRLHRLGAVACFGICLLLFLLFSWFYLEAYGY